MASITQFISVRASSTFTNRSLPQVPQSDNIVLAPVTIHPNIAILQPDEFTIKGQQYIRCSSLARHRRAQRSGFRWSGSMVRTSNPSAMRKSSATKKLATFAADVSDQREMDQGVHVPNSTEGAHHLRRWAFLWRYVVHNKKYVLLNLYWICTGAPERQSWSSTLDWIEVRIQLHANPITSLCPLHEV
ncbi:hypothetical protein V8E54_001537 [Elaphomyces granulatus]